MIATVFYRVVQAVGWLVFFTAFGVVLGTLTGQALRGPGDGESIVPSVSQFRMLGNSVAISLGAVIVALAIGGLAATAMTLARRNFSRRVLAILMLVTILTMPSIHAYAWQLLLTSQSTVVLGFNKLLMTIEPWGARGFTALALGMWLWPIPAWVIADGLRRGGATAMELALLDATPLRALMRGALPVLRGPILSACVVVFLLAATDAAVAPLMLASDVWSVEMLRAAELVRAAVNPAGQLFWRAWPMVVVVIAMAALLLPGARRIALWHHEAEMPREIRRFGRRWLTILAAVVTGIAALLPLFVFAAFLTADERYAFGDAFVQVWHSARGPTVSTMFVALIAGVATFALAIASELAYGKAKFGTRGLIIAAAILVAILPPSLMGTSLVSFYASERLGSAAGWNLYDDTPIAWVAAMVARFGFIPLCLAAMVGLAAPSELRDAAALDGASGVSAWRVARWPFVRSAAWAGAIVAAMLGFSEVQATALTVPPKWGDGSVAFYLDSQMHYQRHGQTLALALLMYVPVVVAAIALSMRRTRFLSVPSPKTTRSN